MGPEDGEYCHRDCGAHAVDWAGNAGQTLYLTDGEPGMDRTRFDWSRHEGYGGAQYNHLYLLAPINTSSPDDGDSWYTASPDPVRFHGAHEWSRHGSEPFIDVQPL
ncbi:hypothetical protein KKF84_10515 [Myxococcota bacterium]|nr:hypothetical protein [Myxococcota bacterium]